MLVSDVEGTIKSRLPSHWTGIDENHCVLMQPYSIAFHNKSNDPVTVQTVPEENDISPLVRKNGTLACMMFFTLPSA